MTAHEDFIKELRAPIVRYHRKLKSEQRRKTKKSYSAGSSAKANLKIMKELEDKFEELFGGCDD